MLPIPKRLASALPWLRFLFGLGCLLTAALGVFPAPNQLAWLLSVGVTEWGHLLALLGLLTLLPGFRKAWPSKLGAACGVAAVALALSPIVRACWMAGSVRADVERAFGTVAPAIRENAPARSAPIVLSDIPFGIATPGVTVQTLSYASPDGTALKFDLYSPLGLDPASAPAPLVIGIHGGAWQGGNREELPALARYLASRGYVYAALDYRLAPAAKFPAAVDDVRAAIAYLKSNATKFHIDPHRLVLFGRSAGGHLALLSAYRLNDPDILGVVSMYAPTDLIWGYNHPTRPSVINSKRVLEDFLGGTPETNADAYRDASPLTFVTASSPPTLLIHGEHDDLVHMYHSERLIERLQDAKRPCLLLRIPWGRHGCDANLGGPGGQISLYAIERFFAACLTASPSDKPPK